MFKRHLQQATFLINGPTLASFGFIIAKLFTITSITNILDNRFGISVYCGLGLSSLPCLSQQWLGVQGRFASLLLVYLQAGEVTVDPADVDTMTNNFQQALKLIN